MKYSDSQYTSLIVWLSRTSIAKISQNVATSCATYVQPLRDMLPTIVYKSCCHGNGFYWKLILHAFIEVLYTKIFEAKILVQICFYCSWRRLYLFHWTGQHPCWVWRGKYNCLEVSDNSNSWWPIGWVYWVLHSRSKLNEGTWLPFLFHSVHNGHSLSALLFPTAKLHCLRINWSCHFDAYLQQVHSIKLWSRCGYNL